MSGRDTLKERAMEATFKQYAEAVIRSNGMGSITREQAQKEAATELTAFEGNATRSASDKRYDLISPHGMDAMARRLKLGADRHGERNWESGGERFRQASVSHLLGHICRYMLHPNQEDADAIICNAMFLCHFEALKLLVSKPVVVDEAPELQCRNTFTSGRSGSAMPCMLPYGHQGECGPRCLKIHLIDSKQTRCERRLGHDCDHSYCRGHVVIPQ
jgi:hypothetical protein